MRALSVFLLAGLVGCSSSPSTNPGQPDAAPPSTTPDAGPAVTPCVPTETCLLNGANTFLSGGTPRASVARAEQLFASLGARVTEPFRDPKYNAARVKIANAALLPSHVWDDSSVWTATTNSRRTLLISGRFAGGRYRLEAARAVPLPSQPAESRHVINLTRLSDDEYAWDTDVPYAIGTATVWIQSGTPV